MSIVKIDGIPVYNAVISDEETGMFKISLVDDPAVMSNFQAFDATRKTMMYAVSDEDRRLVRGIVMRADFPIYRYDQHLGEYYVIYKPDQIRIMAEKYLAESRQNSVNLMHQSGSDVEGVQMVQYFIKGDGVSVEGFDNCADGSLLAEFHILNDDVWAKVKDGTYKGFSLEGVFDLVPERNIDEVQSIVDVLDGLFSKLFKHSNNMSKVSRFKTALAKFLAEFGNITTDKGILTWDGDEDIKVGDAVSIQDMDGNTTPAEDGEYTTEDNKVIVVADGKVAEIKDKEVTEEPEAEPVAAVGDQVDTDKGTLVYEGESLEVGTEVFIVDPENPEAEAVPAPDGEYATDDKIIVVAEGKVAEIKDKPEAEPEGEPVAAEGEDAPAEDEKDKLIKELEQKVADLEAENAELKEKVAEMQKMSAARPAHMEAMSASTLPTCGDKGLDRLARILSAK